VPHLWYPNTIIKVTKGPGNQPAATTRSNSSGRRATAPNANRCGDAMTNGSVFLIDASCFFREGLRRIFAGSSFAAVHESCSIHDALPLIESLQPSLVLVTFPDSGEALTEGISQIRAAAPRTRIVVLTETVRVIRLAEAFSAGVDGYLLKNTSADALHQSLRLVLLGEKVFPTNLAHPLTIDRIMARSEAAEVGRVNGLSDREVQILGFLLDGAPNKQIAHELQISDGTVKTHLKAILKKIGAQNRTQAAIWAASQGMTSLGPLHCDDANPHYGPSLRGVTETATLAKQAETPYDGDRMVRSISRRAKT
jgi:two-component system nitrate/nitrite response regulator NarL